MRQLLVTLLIVSATATGAQTPKPAAPTAATDTATIGTYDLELTTDDGTITGTLVVKRAESGLAADLTVGGNKPTVQSFVREDDHYTLTGGHGTFTVTYRLTFVRDSLSGSFKLSGGLTGTVRGARHK